VSRPLLAVALVACGGAEARPPAAPAPAPAAAAPVAAAAPARPADPLADDLRFCLDETNRYRASVGRPPLVRSAALDAYAAAGARADSRSRRPHQHFSTVALPQPYRELGENIIPWWRLEPGTSVRDILQRGLAGMWAEGPGGGHYENLVGPYTEMGCAILVDRGEVTVVQDFLRSPG
jgi:uncharacterized protein YkwD